jgi:CMP-N-acetylneuraminic acid synthetase
MILTFDLIFDADGLPVNKDALILNSKLRKPHYTIANCFLIFTKQFFLDHSVVIEKYEAGDPVLFPVSQREILDIDTEEQFALVKEIYSVMTS